MAVLDYEQFKGKPFQVVSKLGVRYTGIFDHISQEDQTICLAQVFNHGTEDRPTQRKLPGSSTTLGWVRFHTESIESLALVENYLAPGQEAPVDPILASVSQTAPASVQNPTAAKSRSQPPAPSVPPPASTSQPSYDLPRKPSNAAQSAAKALDRVQKSLSELAVDGPRAQLQPSRRNQPPNARQPEVPDAEFDFSKGTERFEAEREARVVIKGKEKSEDGESQETSEAGTPLEPSQPGRSMSNGSGSALEMGGGKSSTAYSKNSFFDGLSGGSSRISRADERHRNFDTFGEAGGDGYDRGRGGFGGRGGYGGAAGGSGEYGGRGGFGGRGGAGQGYGGQSMGFGRGGSGGGPPRGGFDGPQRGFVNGNGVGGGYRGRGGRGGFGQARAELQPQEKVSRETS